MKTKNALLIGDLHLGSDIIAEFRGYKDAWDFWQCYEEVHNSQVSYASQPVFILGDIAINSDWLSFLNKLKGKLHLVLGNHDILPLAQYQEVASSSAGTVNAMVMLPHEKIVLTHFPVHTCFFEGNKTNWKNYHAHLHTQAINDSRYLGFSWDQAQVNNNSQLFHFLAHV